MPELYRLGSSETTQLFLTTIGGGVVIYILLQFLNWLFSVWASPRLAIYRHFGDHETWALVTGANDGLGKAFSEELLRRGHNVLLHGRNEEKLQRVKKELLERWPKRMVDIVVADASKNDKAYEYIAEKAKSLPGQLTILVNNVGGQTTFPRYSPLADSRHEDLDISINLNSRFPTHLTAALLPLLKANSPSLIINSGSTAGVMPVPYIATYSATKAYIHALSVALKFEMKSQGTPDIEVMGFMIGNTRTTGNPHDMPFFTLEARECASSCLDRVGKGGTVVWSHWKHALQYNITNMIPARIIEPMLLANLRERLESERKGM